MTHGFRLLCYDDSKLWPKAVEHLIHIRNASSLKAIAFQMQKINILMEKNGALSSFFKKIWYWLLKLCGKGAILKTFLRLLSAQKQGKGVQGQPNFLETIQFMADLVIHTPEIFPRDKYLESLKTQIISEIQFSRKQVACLVSHMFFSLISDSSSESFNKNRNFKTLFLRNDNKSSSFLKAIFIYIEALMSVNNKFTRLYMEEEEQRRLNESRSPAHEEGFLNELIWYKKVKGSCLKIDEDFKGLKLTKMTIEQDRSIEDIPLSIKVDFANKFIGGGTLRSGLAQEEIMFIVRPELLPSILFFEKMSDHEAILIKNTIQYAKYKGRIL